jgi:hypothetical protein
MDKGLVFNGSPHVQSLAAGASAKRTANVNSLASEFSNPLLENYSWHEITGPLPWFRLLTVSGHPSSFEIAALVQLKVQRHHDYYTPS